LKNITREEVFLPPTQGSIVEKRQFRPALIKNDRGLFYYEAEN